MKKFTLAFSIIVLFAAGKLFGQVTCNNALTATISNVVNSSTCTTPCNGQATGSASGATTYIWMPGNQSTPTATGLCAGTYTFYAINSTNFNCGSATVTITCANAVNENEMSACLHLYPNPASENISVNFTYPNGGAVKEISVYNSVGEKILDENYSSKKFSGTFFVKHLPSGVYFLELKDEKNSFRTKFIKE